MIGSGKNGASGLLRWHMAACPVSQANLEDRQ